MNSPVVGVCGLLFMALGVYGLAASYVSDRRRATMAPMQTGRGPIVTFVACDVFARKHMGKVEDPPAYIGRQLDRSMNPLVHLRHPVREFKVTMAGMNVRRNREEHREWENRHDIPPRGPVL